VAQAADAAPGALRPDRLRGVLQHRHAQAHQALHGGRVAEQVHGQDRGGVVGQLLLDGGQRHVHGRRVDVREHRQGACVQDRLDAGVEGEAGDDDLGAGLHSQRAQRDRQGVGAVGHADRVLDSQVGGQLGLEGLDLRAEDVATGRRDRGQALGDLVLIRVQGGGEQGDRHGSLPYAVRFAPHRLDHRSHRERGRGRR
jgi:hypothetical protein